MLLDSTVALFLPIDETRLLASALTAIRSANALYISIATIWELQIKNGLGKAPLADRCWDRLRDRGIVYLPIEIEDTILASTLPFHHRDPFDRMIIAQAKRRGLPIVTRDRLFENYGVPIIWA
jgi:PIN domain nuclease of toxin-antitoxin system